VRAGASDGVMTQVEGETIVEGVEVVTGLNAQAGATTDASNPFTPQLMRRGRNAGSR
jgi:hypothetical protein